MKFGVVVFPGSNCDADCYYALKEVLRQNVRYIWHKEKSLSGCDCVVLPGGFSYGDYLRTGAIARFSPVMKEVIRFSKKGGLVIGICNGFQILLEAGLLPGAMMRNTSLRFVCKYVYVKVENKDTPFTNMYDKGEIAKIPIAHNEGNYYAAQDTLYELRCKGQIILRYCTETGEVIQRANPNGSLDNIAGICNKGRNVFGLMPHPERCCEPELGSYNGKKVFESIINYARHN